MIQNAVTFDLNWAISIPEKNMSGTNAPRYNLSAIDKYIGENIQLYRLINGIPLAEMACKLDMLASSFQDAEAGKRRLRASELFVLKKEFGLPLEPFFAPNGEFYSDVASKSCEVADVLHYFLNIEEPEIRSHVLTQIKLASSVF